MKYKIGQLRQNQIAQTPIDIYEKIKYGDEVVFSKTPYGERNQDGAIEYLFEKGKNYHLKFKVNKKVFLNDDILYKIKLKDVNNNYQSLELKNYQQNIVELIFIPKYNFNYLVFEVERDIEYVGNKSAYIYCDELIKAEVLPNIIETSIMETDRLIKVGVQGPTGLIFAINGEKITLGKSRMFTSPEMDIRSIVFLIREDEFIDYENKELLYENRDFFIMDYQYEEGGAIDE